jgi:hypothetical protein
MQNLTINHIGAALAFHAYLPFSGPWEIFSFNFIGRRELSGWLVSQQRYLASLDERPI